MAGHRPIRLPKQWSNHVKAGVLHAISLASVAISCACGRATGQRPLRALCLLSTPIVRPGPAKHADIGPLNSVAHYTSCRACG